MTFKKQINFYLTLFIVCFALSPLVVLAAQDNHQPRTLQSASELDYPPFAIVKQDGTAGGFSVDLLKAVAKTIDHKLNISVGPWHEIKKQLAEGKLDVLPLVAHTKERDKIYDFTVPYLQMHGTIFVRKGEKSISTEKDLKDKAVMVMKGDSSYEYAFSRKLSTKLIQTNSFEEAMKLLSSGKHDAVLCQYLMGLQLIKKLKIKNVVSVTSAGLENLKPSSLVLSGFEQKFCIAVPEGQTELLALLNEGLAIVFANGTYRRLYKKWFEPILPRPAVPLTTVFKYVFSILVPLLLFVAGIGIWYLRHKVATKTQSLRNEIKIRQKAEDDLLESTEKLHLIIDTSPFGICTVDSLGNFITTNLAYEQMLDYSKEELKGLSFFDVTHPDNRPKNKKLFHEMFSIESAGFKMEKMYVRKDGDAINVSVSATAVKGDDGNTRFGTAFIEDITERKQVEAEKEKLETQLQQAQKMESIGNLAGGIAHDFNNILSSILGFTELALEAAPEGSTQRDDLEEVSIAGNRAKELVQQILAFARQSEKETKPVRLSDIVTETLKLLRPSTPATIDIKPTINSAAKVMGNNSQLHQIVMNICTNAIHSLQESGGILEIDLRNIFLGKDSELKTSKLPSGEYVELTITDNGLGIDAAIIENIFEPYFTTKAVGEGSGMGLAMVKGIVESYGGDIQVKSELGEKTSFSIRFPVATGKRSEALDQVDPASSGTERILFVDDEPPIARMGSRMLEGLGYTVTIRTSSFEALELFKEKPDGFDLVITDMTMPSMAGDLLSKEMRKIRHDIPIILCTGYSNQINGMVAKKIGIEALVYKPLTKADLAKTIREVLDEVKGGDLEIP